MSLSLKYKDAYLHALIKELKLRQKYLSGQTVDTIYLGGGTPSLLNEKELNGLFDIVFKEFKVSENPEITLEANPDDLSLNYLQEIKNTPVNRLSIGIQSFFDDDLKMMNRRHSGNQSIAAVKNAQNTGFENISGDLIYGLPKMSTNKWKENLTAFFKLKIQHLSAYHLTYEPNTVFYKKLKNKNLKEIPEEESLAQFKILKQKSEENHFIHYETSNFAKEACFSKHNTAYWQQKYYLGIGTSAHSYDGNSRQYNIKNIKEYINKVEENSIFFEKEILSNKDKYNDYIITSLRTMWGTDTAYILKNYGEIFYKHILKSAKPHLEKENILYQNNFLQLSDKGKFIEDLILKDLFYI